jgi:ferredoxin
MKVNVDADVCIGCGLCTEICPEVFKLEDGVSVAICDHVLPLVEDSCREAAESCPVSAIEITE